MDAVTEIDVRNAAEALRELISQRDVAGLGLFLRHVVGVAAVPIDAEDAAEDWSTDPAEDFAEFL